MNDKDCHWTPAQIAAFNQIENILREHFARNKRIMRTMILGPMIVVKNWQEEFKMHSKISPTEVVALVGAGKKRIAEFAAKAAAPDGTLTRGRIFISNYESTEMEELYDLYLQWKPEILICDESQRLKNHKAVRAKNVVRLADRADHRYILTGTPILNSATDIFHQFRILDGGRSFSIADKFSPEGWRPMNFTEFRATYFEDENAGMLKKKETAVKYFPNWMPRPSTYEELNAKIYRKAMRVEKKSCLDPAARAQEAARAARCRSEAHVRRDEEGVPYFHQDPSRSRGIAGRGSEPRAHEVAQASPDCVRLREDRRGRRGINQRQSAPSGAGGHVR